MALAYLLQAVDYSTQTARYHESSPMDTKRGRKAQDSDSDTDFQERDESEEEPESEEEGAGVIASDELESDARRPRSMHSSMVSSPKNPGKLIPVWLKPRPTVDNCSSRLQTRPSATHGFWYSVTTSNSSVGRDEKSSGYMPCMWKLPPAGTLSSKTRWSRILPSVWNCPFWSG